MQTKALKCGSTEFKHQIPTSPMYSMSQLIGGRKKKTKDKKTEAAWGTLGGTLPHSSRKRTDKIPCPAALLALTSPSPTNRAGGLLGTPAITTIAMATWDLSAGGGLKREKPSCQEKPARTL